MVNEIHRLFKSWSLTETEIAIAYLILKGLSLRAISELRQTKEKTIRAQSGRIYLKAGVAGRCEFAGLFFQKFILRDGASAENSLPRKNENQTS